MSALEGTVLQPPPPLLHQPHTPNHKPTSRSRPLPYLASRCEAQHPYSMIITMATVRLDRKITRQIRSSDLYCQPRPLSHNPSPRFPSSPSRIPRLPHPPSNVIRIDNITLYWQRDRHVHSPANCNCATIIPTRPFKCGVIACNCLHNPKLIIVF